MSDLNEVTCSGKEICIQNAVSDDSNDERGYVLIEELKIQFPPFLFLPPRRRGFYASDSNDEEIIEKISNKGIGGDGGVSIEKGVEEIVEEVVEEVVRTRSGREVKKARWSLPYHLEMKEKREGV
jgi:hypothetical protein